MEAQNKVEDYSQIHALGATIVSFMETGVVAVNTPVVAIAEAPFGGIKQTGYGREGGSMAIKDYLNIKYTHLGIKG